MMPKSGYTPKGFYEYTIFPLEGIWSLTEEGKKQDIFNKDELTYTIMVRQPDFVTEIEFQRAIATVKKKKPSKFLDEIYFDIMEDGLSVQMMHVGSYDNEEESFNSMKQYINDNNLEILTLEHREIYISDARKVGDLKTVLRYRVKHKD
ncbi:hypothetical protein D3C76_954790 [compost metagenome]